MYTVVRDHILKSDLMRILFSSNHEPEKGMLGNPEVCEARVACYPRKLVRSERSQNGYVGIIQCHLIPRCEMCVEPGYPGSKPAPVEILHDPPYPGECVNP